MLCLNFDSSVWWHYDFSDGLRTCSSCAGQYSGLCSGADLSAWSLSSQELPSQSVLARWLATRKSLAKLYLRPTTPPSFPSSSHKSVAGVLKDFTKHNHLALWIWIRVEILPWSTSLRFVGRLATYTAFDLHEPLMCMSWVCPECAIVIVLLCVFARAPWASKLRLVVSGEY